MTKKLLLLTLIYGCLAAHQVSAGGQNHYKTPPEYAAAGNFSFKYPSELTILQDYVYTTPAGEPGPHVVILKHRDAVSGNPSDQRYIEINMVRTDCGQYVNCRVMDGINIGTQSQDPSFLALFNEVASNFKAK